MPYIKPEIRKDLAINPYPTTAGELNYMITRLLRSYFLQNPSYQTANDILGALEGAKLEFYRRVVEPYEDDKMIENGDVY